MRRVSRVAAAALVALAAAPVANAATPAAPAVLTTLTTAGCPAPPLTWRMSYVLFWRTAKGQTLATDNLSELLEEAQTFADIVGRNTECNLGMSVDVYEMGDRPFTGRSTVDSYSLGKLPHGLRAGYDSMMLRAPATGAEQYGGITDVYGMVTYIPADSAAAYQPWEGLILHEWLHIAVGWFEPSQGWPRGDVHGAWHYPPHSGQTDMDYFAEMMNGTVTEPDGSHTGMLPAEWSYQGTPTHLRHFDSRAVVNIRPDGRLRLYSIRNIKAYLTVTLTNLRTGRTKTLDAAALAAHPPLAPGRWRVCAEVAETLEFLHTTRCRTRTLHRRVSSH